MALLTKKAPDPCSIVKTELSLKTVKLCNKERLKINQPQLRIKKQCDAVKIEFD